MPQDGNMEGLLQELEVLFLGAISKTPATRQKIEQLRRDGYQLALRLECHRAEEVESKTELDTGPDECATWLPAPAEDNKQPQFMIDRGDFTFLRSIGIDPTKKKPARTRRVSEADRPDRIAGNSKS